jgi:DNA invertase Pin-like site-specific DNA recombinase
LKKKWLIYTRVSTKGQEEKYGLDAQKNILTDYAKKMGWHYELLNEGAVSGETIIERPKMIELLNKVKTGDYEGCLIIEDQRLSRSSRLGDWDVIKEAFIEGKAKIATPSKIVDPENIEDEFRINLEAVLSKREKDIILRRMTRGKVEKLKQGKSIGGTSIPFGYRANPENHEIEICPEEKKVYDMITDWVLDDQGLYTVANKLNEMGIPTRYGRKGWKMKDQPSTNLWRASTLYKILKQEFYTGLKPKTFHFTKYHVEDVDVYYPALISPENFGEVQDKLATQHIRKREHSYFFLLKDLLRCGLCGRKMYGQGAAKQRKNGRTYVYKFYRCENRNPPPKGINCQMKSVEQYRIEDVVWNDVLTLINNSNKLAQFIKDKQESMDDTIKDSFSKLETLQETLSKKDEEEKRLVTAYSQGVIELKDLKREKKRIIKERTEIQKEVNKLESKKRSLLLDKVKNRSIQEYFQQIKKKVSSLTPEGIYTLYHLCIDSITVNYDKKKGSHSIAIDFAIPIGGLEKFTSRDDENPQCCGCPSQR